MDLYLLMSCTEKKNAYGVYVLQTVKRAATYRSECLPLLMIASRDGTDHTRHYFYGLLFFLFYPLIFSSQIESLQYGPIQRGFLYPYVKCSRYFPFYHRCGRYFMYVRITSFCLILERVGAKNRLCRTCVKYRTHLCCIQ